MTLNTAITREISPEINQCELTFVKRSPIDLEKAKTQHANYRAALAQSGLSVVQLPALAGLPDGLFVEDPAIILDDIAILTHMGTESRQPEVEHLAQTLRDIAHSSGLKRLASSKAEMFCASAKPFREFQTFQSRRCEPTSHDCQPHFYTVKSAEISGCLHLKTGCSYLGRNTILLNPSWVPARCLWLHLINIDPSEPFAANALPSATQFFTLGFPKTQAKLEQKGFKLHLLDISELQKAEAGLTCLSQVFEVLPHTIY